MMRLTKVLSGWALGAVVLAGCGGAHPLADLSVPPLPEWTDRYADSKSGDVVFFNQSELMARYGLDRLQAIELQNHYRDLTREGQSPEPALAEAVKRVRAGVFESGLDRAVLAKARFIVVWDLDETLYDQYHTPADCADLRFERPGKADKKILLAPGWQAAFERIKAAGGVSILFSANLDGPTKFNLDHWSVGQTPLLESGLVAGWQTNSYLMQQDKREGPGAKDPRKGQPVIEPSKDLRPFDETLQKVVIIDDNPSRLFQLRNARTIPKLRGDRYCTGSPDERASFEQTLPLIVDELETAAAAAQAQSIPFAQAWLPYSILGRIKVRHLMQSRGWSQQTADDWVRSHPEAVPDAF